MAAQLHKIMREVIEVRGCPEGRTAAIASELRRACDERLLPLIDSVCSDASGPGRLHRIDRLEIDLGRVPLEALGPALGERFEAAFRRELSLALEHAPTIDSDLELFACFIRTGTVPWWADASDPSLLGASLDALLARAPGAVRGQMLGVADAERMRRRVARAFSDRALDALACALANGAAASAAWAALLESVAVARGHPASAGRHVWWEEVLRAACAGAWSTDAAGMRPVLARFARALNEDYAAVVAAIARAAEADETMPIALRRIAEDLGSELHPATQPRDAQPSADVRGALADVLEQERLDAPTVARHTAVLERSPPALAIAGTALTADALAAPGSKLLAAAAAPRTPPHDAVSDLHFAAADEIYIGNAGLVVLWPFLERFFERLALVQDKGFRHDAARSRAAGLLQYVAAADQAPPEYLLPLNKVLCGLAPEEVFDFGPDITRAEIEECDDLVKAAIGQATILRDMSVEGFRASFLLRRGKLATRDGNWWLYVERETHDIVLDRFPWSIQFVHLPWMETMMQVEW
ncbi:MAG: hypothetical protein JWM26_3290 [Betaproteobacteria bacterium]|nr:hypothetical protein [Betaproteobacteria bacterium]